MWLRWQLSLNSICKHLVSAMATGGCTKNVGYMCEYYCSYWSRNRLRRRVYHSCGPNYVWHINGYHKLKQYRVAISGCIDGFFRKMIWLEA